MVDETPPSVVRRDDLSCRLWFGPGLLIDFRRQAERPALAVRGCHAVGGFEVPSIPLPYDELQVPVSQIYKDHRDRFLTEMSRMLLGLHEPAMWRGSTRERLLTVTSYDLRITNDLDRNDADRIRFFLLFKVFVPVDRAGDDPAAVEAAMRQAGHAARLCRAQSPASLSLRPVRWDDDPGPTDRLLGLAGPFEAFGELRRENCLTTLRTETEYQKFCDALHRQQIFAAPEPWPPAAHDLGATCAFLAAAAERAMVSVRIQPTVRTQNEHAALLDFLNELRQDGSQKNRHRPRHVRNLLTRVWRSRELFQTCVSTAAESELVLRDLLATYASEFTYVWSHEGAEDDESLGPKQRPARLPAIADREREVARFNLFNLEQLPWGAVSEKAAAASIPAGGVPRGLPSVHTFAPTDSLRLPDMFLQRDLETNPQFVRFRSLLTLREAASVWRLPLASRIGGAGFSSRLPSPFPRHAVSTSDRDEADMTTIGRVVHRGLPTNERLRLGAWRRAGGVPCLAEQVVVVAGGLPSTRSQFARRLVAELLTCSPNATGLVALDLNGQGAYRALQETAPEIRFRPPPAFDGDAPMPASLWQRLFAGLRRTRSIAPSLARRLEAALEQAAHATAPPVERRSTDGLTDERSDVSWSALERRIVEASTLEHRTLAGGLLEDDWRLLCGRFRRPTLVPDGGPDAGMTSKTAGPANWQIEIDSIGRTVCEAPPEPDAPFPLWAPVCGVAWCRDALDRFLGERPSVVVVDGLDRLRAAGGGASGSCDAVEFLRGMSDLRRTDSAPRLLILVDDAPPWRRYAELFSCPLLPVQFAPAGETEAEALAEHLMLSSDQRQYVGRALQPDHFLTIDPAGRTPLILRSPDANDEPTGETVVDMKRTDE